MSLRLRLSCGFHSWQTIVLLSQPNFWTCEALECEDLKKSRSISISHFFFANSADHPSFIHILLTCPEALHPHPPYTRYTFRTLSRYLITRRFPSIFPVPLHMPSLYILFPKLHIFTDQVAARMNPFNMQQPASDNDSDSLSAINLLLSQLSLE